MAFFTLLLDFIVITGLYITSFADLAFFALISTSFIASIILLRVESLGSTVPFSIRAISD